MTVLRNNSACFHAVILCSYLLTCSASDYTVFEHSHTCSNRLRLPHRNPILLPFFFLCSSFSTEQADGSMTSFEQYVGRCAPRSGGGGREGGKKGTSFKQYVGRVRAQIRRGKRGGEEGTPASRVWAGARPDSVERERKGGGDRDRGRPIIHTNHHPH